MAVLPMLLCTAALTARVPVLAYRYTGAEFSQKSVLSIQPLIDSYGVNSTGTLLVVEENRVSASNDPTLIGMNIFRE